MTAGGHDDTATPFLTERYEGISLAIQPRPRDRARSKTPCYTASTASATWSRSSSKAHRLRQSIRRSSCLIWRCRWAMAWPRLTPRGSFIAISNRTTSSSRARVELRGQNQDGPRANKVLLYIFRDRSRAATLSANNGSSGLTASTHTGCRANRKPASQAPGSRRYRMIATTRHADNACSMTLTGGSPGRCLPTAVFDTKCAVQKRIVVLG